uniref:Uncharacterized protein n=1 Tax=Glossina austeni TaxID=7395 RepID=A0A1A9VN51_GLOAU
MCLENTYSANKQRAESPTISLRKAFCNILWKIRQNAMPTYHATITTSTDVNLLNRIYDVKNQQWSLSINYGNNDDNGDDDCSGDDGVAVTDNIVSCYELVDGSFHGSRRRRRRRRLGKNACN